MSLTTAQIANAAFIEKVAAEPAEAAAYGSQVIRDHIREAAFCRQIIPMVNIGPGAPGLQVSLENDTFTKVEWFETKSRAMVFNFRGGPTARLIKGPKAAMGFFSIASEKFEITTQELMTYPFPITKMIEDNTPLDIEEIEDREWVQHVESAVQAVQQEGNGGVATALNLTTLGAASVTEWAIVKGERARNASTNDAVARPLERPDIAALKRLHFNTRNRADKILITDSDLSHVDAWTIEDLGSQVEGETAKTGWKSPTLLGLTVVRTIKGKILRPGNVYSFCKPNYLGRSYQLGQMQFFAKKEGNRLMWWAWEDIAMAILNVAGVKKLELYSGDANPTTDSDSIVASVIPDTEEAPFEYQALAHKGVYFPKVVIF
jgi:hypothetical protein